MVNTRELRRITTISRIKATLKKLQEKNLDYDEEKFLIEIMRDAGTTRRTAKEYLQIAESMLIQEKNSAEEEANKILL